MVWDTAQWDKAYRDGLTDMNEILKRRASMPCLKQQREWVKAEIAFDEAKTPRDHEMLVAILGSLENLAARVEAEVEVRRRAVAMQQGFASSEPEL